MLIVSNKSLQQVCSQLAKAKFPEDIFGDLGPSISQTDSLHRLRRTFLAFIHEDRYLRTAHKVVAREASQKLSEWFDQAVKKIAEGTYGNKNAVSITVKSSTNVYRTKEKLASGDLCEVYTAVEVSSNLPMLIKAVRNPKNNDLMSAEAKALSDINLTLPEELKNTFIPSLVESFKIKEKKIASRQVNVLGYLPTFYPLREVMRQYPDGVDPRDLTWMTNRMFTALKMTHSAGYIHGSINPDHFLIDPATHNGRFVGWGYSVQKAKVVKAIPLRNQKYYPLEILFKKPALPTSDIYMMAQTMMDVLGKFEGGGASQFRRFFTSCLYPKQEHRPDDITALAADFGEMTRGLFGPKKFRHFKLNK